jgi:[acyl-carrier-protein] S-malonyltransferase
MIAFMFPGQGSQFVGMGKTWAEGSAIAASYFERANRALGRDLAKVCFEGPEVELTDTKNAQVAIYTVSCIAARLLFDLHLIPDYVLGHSIGEYAALYYARAFDFETGLLLVQKRADAMTRAAEAHPGSMAAVLRLDPGLVEKTCAELSAEGPGVLSVAGFNSPEQTVISGSKEMVDRAIAVFKEKGAKRVVPLAVSGAFHSGLMEQAQVAFQAAVDATPFRKPSTLFISNNDARPVTEAGPLSTLLPRQLTSPVRWTDSLAFLKRQGCQAYVETGPGTVLVGLLAKFDPDAASASLSDLASFEAAAQQFRACECGVREKFEALD